MSRQIPLGFIGLGLMGLPIALRLVNAGHPLHIWGRNPARLTPAINAGAQIHDAAADVAAAADLIFLCLSDTNAVENVVFGPKGLGNGAGEKTLVVDHSSIEPEATIDFARQLQERTGGHWIDAPVSGGPTGARAGTLAIMAGGRPDDFERALPCFEIVGQATLLGPVGSGQTTKLLNQLIVGCTLAVVAESVRFAQKSGIDPSQIPKALAGGRADSTILQQYMEKMASDDQTVESHIDTLCKDLNTAGRLARNLGLHSPMLTMAREFYNVMAKRGRGDADVSRIIEYLD